MSTPQPPGAYALHLTGTPAASDYVTFGAAPGLNAASFTVETWFKRDATGVATSTGTGGLSAAIPLVTKGRADADGSNLDLDYFLGINNATNVLAGDIEEGVGGVTLGRASARAVCRRRASYLQRTLIVGAGDVGQTIARKLRRHREYGIDLLGFGGRLGNRLRRGFLGKRPTRRGVRLGDHHVLRRHAFRLGARLRLHRRHGRGVRLRERRRIGCVDAQHLDRLRRCSDGRRG